MRLFKFDRIEAIKKNIQPLDKGFKFLKLLGMMLKLIYF